MSCWGTLGQQGCPNAINIDATNAVVKLVPSVSEAKRLRAVLGQGRDKTDIHVSSMHLESREVHKNSEEFRRIGDIKTKKWEQTTLICDETKKRKVKQNI